VVRAGRLETGTRSFEARCRGATSYRPCGLGAPVSRTLREESLCSPLTGSFRGWTKACPISVTRAPDRYVSPPQRRGQLAGRSQPDNLVSPRTLAALLRGLHTGSRDRGGGVTEIFVLAAVLICGALAVLLIALRS
jgi:hypothetical protein